MTANQWLDGAVSKLVEAGIGTARLDCLVLLEDATGKDRGWLLAHPEFPLDPKVLSKLNTWITQRAKHEPLAYIRQKTEFYGREFILSRQVLEPRPESETMIDLLKQTMNKKRRTRNEKVTIVDVGTGSGAIGITAALEFPDSQVILTDIDPKCLQIARQNAIKHNVGVEFVEGNLLQPLFSLLHSSFSVLLCNLPYVPDHYQINEAALMEPRIAIFGGSDGLNLYRKMFKQTKQLAKPPEYLFTESLPFQHRSLEEIAQVANYVAHKTEDFIQVFGQ